MIKKLKEKTVFALSIPRECTLVCFVHVNMCAILGIHIRRVVKIRKKGYFSVKNRSVWLTRKKKAHGVRRC